MKVVKLHESTLRKRLNEFGATTTALLTLGKDSFELPKFAALSRVKTPSKAAAAMAVVCGHTTNCIDRSNSQLGRSRGQCWGAAVAQR